MSEAVARISSTLAASVPGTSRSPASASSRFASTLSPMRAITSASGPMKTRSLSSHAWTNAGFSDEKAVAGMDRVASGRLGGGDDRRDVEVALRRLGGPMQTARSARRVCSVPASAVE